MNVANLNEPSILGFAITPWLIILFISAIGIIVSLIMIMSALARKNKKEIELINMAAANTSKIPVKDIDISSLSLDNQADNETEAFAYTDKTGTNTLGDINKDSTEGFDKETESFYESQSQTEGFNINSETESFTQIDQTQGFETMTVPFEEQTEGLSGLDGEAPKAKFCEQCGHRIAGKGKFCSHCGSKII